MVRFIMFRVIGHLDMDAFDASVEQRDHPALRGQPVMRTFGLYLALVIAAPQVQRRIVVTGTGLQRIHLRDLRAAGVPFPPEAEQQEIVRRVEALFAQADQIEARFQKAQAQGDKLTPSLLARAFRAQFVPQDSNDRPAEKCWND